MRGRNKGVTAGLLTGLAALVVVLGALFIHLRRQGEVVPVVDAGAPLAAVPDAAPAIVEERVEPEIEPATGRPLTPDEILRKVAKEGSPSAELATWLSADGVLRRIAAAVLLVSQGRSPRNMLGFIPIHEPFDVVDTLVASKGAGDDRILMSKKSTARYDVLATVLKSADVSRWGRGYRRLRPHFNAAFSEVADPGQRFDEVLSAAIQRVLDAKVPEGEIELREQGALFTYADPALESLSEVEKHVIRLGPANAKVVQDALRIFAQSAGLR